MIKNTYSKERDKRATLKKKGLCKCGDVERREGIVHCETDGKLAKQAQNVICSQCFWLVTSSRVSSVLTPCHAPDVFELMATQSSKEDSKLLRWQLH